MLNEPSNKEGTVGFRINKTIQANTDIERQNKHGRNASLPINTRFGLEMVYDIQILHFSLNFNGEMLHNVHQSCYFVLID
jgi:hypothetical protein